VTCTIIARLTPAEQQILLKLYSSVSCGFPSPAEDFAEPELSLDDLVGLREPSMFLVRAAGDSMIGTGIFHDDVLIVDRALAPFEGCVLIASVDEGFLAKTYRIQKNGCPALYAENPAYPPILLGSDDQLEVFGICTWNLHRLSGRR
jgi:DNA polymerase V